jgi:dihydrolipoamide dehydrogenase-binding protein of pyruvate dehydrogenase complex
VNAINPGGVPQSMSRVDISVAVATEGGLITPIVVNVPGLDVAQISQTVKVRALYFARVLL